MLDFYSKKLLNSETDIDPNQELDYFKFTINSGNDASFILPTGSVYGGGQSFNWKINWGDGTESVHTGTDDYNSGTGITHNYSAANTNYQITIQKNDNSLKWLQCFGFFSNANGCNIQSNKDKMISLDSPFTLNMFLSNVSAMQDSYLFYYMFHKCTNLTMGSKFNLPQNITSTGIYFCSAMFQDCTNLTMGSKFNLPQNITSAGNSFCYYMFYNCINLTMNSKFNLPQNITSIGTGFCNTMFNHCNKLLLNDIFQLPQNIISVGNAYCSYMFASCNNLILNNIFQLPQNIHYIGSYFCSYMFDSCKKITTGVQHFFGNLQLSQTELNRNRVFKNTFWNCSSITEEISPDTIPQLQISPSSSNECFENCPADMIINCPANWK